MLAKLGARTPRLADPPKTCDSLIDIGDLAGSHSLSIPTMARGKQVARKATGKEAAAAKVKPVRKVAVGRKPPTIRDGKLISQKETAALRKRAVREGDDPNDGDFVVQEDDPGDGGNGDDDKDDDDDDDDDDDNGDESEELFPQGQADPDENDISADEYAVKTVSTLMDRADMEVDNQDGARMDTGDGDGAADSDSDSDGRTGRTDQVEFFIVSKNAVLESHRNGLGQCQTVFRYNLYRCSQLDAKSKVLFDAVFEGPYHLKTVDEIKVLNQFTCLINNLQFWAIKNKYKYIFVHEDGTTKQTRIAKKLKKCVDARFDGASSDAQEKTWASRKLLLPKALQINILAKVLGRMREDAFPPVKMPVTMLRVVGSGPNESGLVTFSKLLVRYFHYYYFVLFLTPCLVLCGSSTAIGTAMSACVLGLADWPGICRRRATLSSI